MRTWLICRLALGYVTDRVRLTAPLFGADLGGWLVAATVSQANLGHLQRDPAATRAWGRLDTVAPEGLRRPISAYAAAGALGMSRETVRRKLKALTEAGFLVEGEGGWRVRPGRTAEPDAVRLVEAVAARTAGFCAELAAAGSPEAAALLAEPVGPDGTLPRAVVRASGAFALRMFEEIRVAADGDLAAGTAFLALAQANVRHLDWRADPALFRDGPPPAQLRRPLPALTLAAELGLPRETVRRHLARLTALGHVRADPEGLVADPRSLPEALRARLVARTGANVRLLLKALRGTGTAAFASPAPAAALSAGSPGSP